MEKIIELQPRRVVWVVNIQDDRRPDYVLSEIPERNTISVTILAPSWESAQDLRRQAETELQHMRKRRASV